MQNTKNAKIEEQQSMFQPSQKSRQLQARPMKLGQHEPPVLRPDIGLQLLSRQKLAK
jgi:hypothetical protein